MQIDRRLVVFALVLVVAPALAREEGSFDRTLNVTGPVDLEVQTNSGHITVRAGDATSVRVHGIIGVNNEWLSGDATQRVREIESNPPIHQTGNTIRIEPLAEESLRRHISIAYELVVPAQTKLRARTGSGRQSVEGIHGPVNVSTGSGGIHISKIDDEVIARTGSGRIELDAIKGKVDAHTGSGGIQGSNISGPITAHTGSGSLRLDQTSVGPVKAHTGSGGVNLHLPSDAAFDLYAHTGSGHVYVDHPITVRGTIRRQEMQGKVRGGGPLVDVSTGSGSVRIE